MTFNRFTSRGLDGSAKFKVVVEATQPQCSATTLPNEVADYAGCPDGPCCDGEGCCTVAVSTEATISSPNYPTQYFLFMEPCCSRGIQYGIELH